MSSAPLLAPAGSWRSVLHGNAVSEKMPADLAGLLDDGRPGFLNGRYSGSDGPEARRMAVDDLYGSAEVLAHNSGIDLSPVLPDRQTLIHALEEAPVTTSMTIDGTRFRNRYAVLDLRQRAGVVLLLSNGTGHLLDEEGRQPFVEEATSLIRRYRAAFFACKRLDRLAREDWGAAPIMVAIRQLGMFLSDEEGLGRMDTARSISSFVRGTGSRNQASNLPKASRTGQVNRSGDVFLDGRVAYHIQTTPPPGCGVVWLKGAGTTPTERVLYLDCDGARPSPAQVASGLAEVYDVDGQPVDQVANVRFLLSRYGHPDWPARRLIDELEARGFSTPGLRSHNGDVSATIDADRSGRQVLSTVMGHLQNYERQELHIQVGAAEEPHVITNFAPLDGEPWATEADFARIRNHLRDRDQRLEKAVHLTFAGLKARLNGRPVTLITGQRSSESAPRRYRFVDDRYYPERSVPVVRRLNLPPDLWAASIVQSLRAVDQEVLPRADLLDPESGPDDGVGRARGELTTIERELAAAESRLDALFTRMEERDSTGELVATGQYFTRLQQDYNQLAETELPKLRARRDQVAKRLDDLLAARPDAAEASQLLHLVASLKDPQDARYRQLWLASLHHVEFTHTPPEPGQMGRRLSWRGAIEFGTPDGAAVLIPFAGLHDTIRRQGVPQNAVTDTAVDRCLQAMSDGVPFRQVEVPNARFLIGALRERLGGISGAGMPILTCEDPALVRITTRALLRRDEPASRVATELSVPVRLIERVRDINLNPSRGWLIDADRSEVAAYVLAARDQGWVHTTDVMELADASRGSVYNLMSRLRRETPLWESHRKRGYRLRACECGSLARAPMRLREVSDVVCLGCRRDLAGMVWPEETYDRYRAHPDLWTEGAE